MRLPRLATSIPLFILLVAVTPVFIAHAFAPKCANGGVSYVKAVDYLACKDESGFAFDGSQTIKPIAFCQSMRCRNVVESLQNGGGMECLDVAGMASILEPPTDDLGTMTVTVNCASISDAKTFLPMVPAGDFGGCTQEMRSRLNASSYQGCHKDSGIVFLPSKRETKEGSVGGFCKSTDCRRVLDQLQTQSGTACLKETNLAFAMVTSEAGTTVDCSSVKDTYHYDLVPLGTINNGCTAKMRSKVPAELYRACQDDTQFNLSAPDAKNVKRDDFCRNKDCQKFVDRLQLQNGTVCLDIPDMADILVKADLDGDGEEEGRILNCSAHNNSLDFTLMPSGVYGACVPAMRQFVDEVKYRGCRRDSGFTFDGSESIVPEKFCGSNDCASMVFDLQKGNGSTCLDVDGMDAILSRNPEDNTIAVNCGALSNLYFTVLPAGVVGNSCTEEQRAKVVDDHYRHCNSFSSFTFDSVTETDADMFCKSKYCKYMYDALMVANGTSCINVTGLHNGIFTVNDMVARELTNDWCTFTALNADGSATGAGLSTGALVGIIVAVVVVVGVVVVVVWLRRRRSSKDKTDGHYYSAPGADGSSAPPHHTTGSTSDGTNSSSLANDPVIVAARIPYEKLVFGDLLGSGAYGSVYRGMYRAEPVAIKTLLTENRYDLAHIEKFLAEVKIMAAMDHPRIVKFIGVSWDALTELCVVSELMPRGDLRDVLTQFEDAKSALARPHGFDADKIRIAFHVIHALAYLHSLQPVVLHRDLKSRNILVDDQLNAKVTDFGISREVVGRTMTVGVGSALWMAPEVMAGDHYDEKADVFSFGVVLSELDTHALPYSNATDSNGAKDRPIPAPIIVQKVVLGQLSVAFSSSGDQCEMTELAQECIAVKPEDRPSTAEVLSRVHKIQRGAVTYEM